MPRGIATLASFVRNSLRGVFGRLYRVLAGADSNVRDICCIIVMPTLVLVAVLLCCLAAEGHNAAQLPSLATQPQSLPPPNALTAHQVWRWREDTRGMLRHAYGSYMRHAYPADELKPLSCVGREWNRRERGTLDDCLGGYSLTLIDSLSTLAMTGDLPAFRRGVARVIAEVRATCS